MSQFRVCKMTVEQKTPAQNIKFDNKEDAEHFAKNQSSTDDHYVYEIQKNNQGEFSKIKAYFKGQEI